jgi:hypothetical protein
MRSSTLARILGILVVAIIVGGLIGWWAGRDKSRPEIIPQPSVQESTTTTKPTTAPTVTTEITETSDAPDPTEVSTNAFDPELWEERLDEILGDADDDTDRKANQLLDMMDKVNASAQEEIAGHIVNLVDDKDFVARVSKYLTNAAVPESVSSVFMNDLYNRDELIKLPLVLAVARNEKHPLRDEAKDLLELYVEEDYGTDWAKWEAATKKYLQEHGAEPAPEPPPDAP